jgi:hypothetical protein
MHKLVATFSTCLQMELGAADTQGPGEEGQTGNIGRPFHWRSGQAQTHIPVTQSFQAFDTCPRLHPQA